MTKFKIGDRVEIIGEKPSKHSEDFGEIVEWQRSWIDRILYKNWHMVKCKRHYPMRFGDRSKYDTHTFPIVHRSHLKLSA